MFEYELIGRAAELAYYSMLALAPALVMLVSAVGLLTTSEELGDLVAGLTAGDAARGAVEGIVKQDTGAGVALGGGLITAAWSVSLYTAAFERAAAAAQGTPFARVPWRRRLWLMPVTVLAVIALGVALGFLLLTGEGLAAVADAVGLGGLTSGASAVVRWPLLAGVVVVIVYALYRLAPGGEGRRRPSTGALVAAAGWLFASLGFAVYTATIATYESTYGTLSGVVSFLVWLWLSNLVLLFGVALDAELHTSER